MRRLSAAVIGVQGTESGSSRHTNLHLRTTMKSAWFIFATLTSVVCTPAFGATLTIQWGTASAKNKPADVIISQIPLLAEAPLKAEATVSWKTEANGESKGPKDGQALVWKKFKEDDVVGVEIEGERNEITLEETLVKKEVKFGTSFSSVSIIGEGEVNDDDPENVSYLYNAELAGTGGNIPKTNGDVKGPIYFSGSASLEDPFEISYDALEVIGIEPSLFDLIVPFSLAAVSLSGPLGEALYVEQLEANSTLLTQHGSETLFSLSINHFHGVSVESLPDVELYLSDRLYPLSLSSSSLVTVDELEAAIEAQLLVDGVLDEPLNILAYYSSLSLTDDISSDGSGVAAYTSGRASNSFGATEIGYVPLPASALLLASGLGIFILFKLSRRVRPPSPSLKA